ncbi:MAG: rRNA pseudouridine synthase [Oscillospiraceae bacterium]|nr:rRNA pseudouridine synthase [Oscillospiraceae bacterium]
MQKRLRIDKILVDTGLFSRKEAVSAIRSGKVSAGGLIVKSNSEKFDPEVVQIVVDGKPLQWCKFFYIMMNKPSGFVSATEDLHEKTVIELLDERLKKVGLYPAGRLDKDAQGFLLLTNDGAFAHMIISPGKGVSKRYFVEIDGDISADDIAAFADGLVLGDGTKCLSAVLEKTQGGAFVSLFEGKYHQVKRMMAAIGKPVKFLKRVAIGGLELDENLSPGAYRAIDITEINKIFQK